MSWKGYVDIEVGDIAEAKTEAVVNAANHELWMGSGVAGALRKAGGSVIEQEAVKQGPISVGGSVLTSAGNLPSLHVIHAAAMAAGRRATPESVKAATASALMIAQDNKIHSVAFPALGTGVGAVSFHECAEAMFSAVRDHINEYDYPREIKFVLFGQNAYDVFVDVMASM